MNAGVALVRAYLRLNGYLTLDEVPISLPDEETGGYRTHTDLDIVAVRFPCVRMGFPDRHGRIAEPLAPDPNLATPTDAIDVIIGEVKEGRATLNRAVRSPATLRLGLARIGLCDPAELEAAAEALTRQADFRLDADRPMREIRLVAFGMGTSRRTDSHYVVSLRDVEAFVERVMEEGHELLLPATISDPVLGLLHLANKLR